MNVCGCMFGFNKEKRFGVTSVTACIKIWRPTGGSFACCSFSLHQLLIFSLLVCENTLTFHEDEFKGEKHTACELQ